MTTIEFDIEEFVLTNNDGAVTALDSRVAVQGRNKAKYMLFVVSIAD